MQPKDLYLFTSAAIATVIFVLLFFASLAKSFSYKGSSTLDVLTVSIALLTFILWAISIFRIVIISRRKKSVKPLVLAGIIILNFFLIICYPLFASWAQNRTNLIKQANRPLLTLSESDVLINNCQVESIALVQLVKSDNERIRLFLKNNQGKHLEVYELYKETSTDNWDPIINSLKNASHKCGYSIGISNYKYPEKQTLTDYK